MGRPDFVFGIWPGGRKLERVTPNVAQALVETWKPRIRRFYHFPGGFILAHTYFTHTTMRDAQKFSCQCRVRFTGGQASSLSAPVRLKPAPSLWTKKDPPLFWPLKGSPKKVDPAKVKTCWTRENQGHRKGKRPKRPSGQVWGLF